MHSEGGVLSCVSRVGSPLDAECSRVVLSASVVTCLVAGPASNDEHEEYRVCVNHCLPHCYMCGIYFPQRGYATMVYFILSFLMACAPDAVSADLPDREPLTHFCAAMVRPSPEALKGGCIATTAAVFGRDDNECYGK